MTKIMIEISDDDYESIKRWMRYKDTIADIMQQIEDAELILSSAENSNKCDDAISRQAVLDEMYKRQEDGDAITAGFIKKLPSVTPLPKMGRWIPRNAFLVPYKCSECNYESERYDNYCPNCGAKMESE